jgi:ATP-dependent Clp protease ATP-binding subunit ClpC
MGPESQKHLERAIHLLSSGAWAEAVGAYEAALAVVPDLLEAAIGLARVRELRVQWSYAADTWTRVLEIDPEHAEAATARAECLRQAGCYHLALPAYDEALMLDGEQLYALAGKAETLRMLGRPDEALHWFDRSLAVHEEHTFALRGKAAALNALCRFEEAIPYWENAAALDPSSTFAGQGLKEARLGLARAAEGIVQVPPVPPPPLVGDALAAEIDFDWGRALAHDERWAESAAAFERSLEKRPDRVEVLRELARVYEQARRGEDAYDAWSRLHELQPDRAEASAAQGDALRNARRYVEALDAYDRALAIDPQLVGSLAGRAETLRLLGRWDEAVRWFNRALERKPTHPFALRGKASALNDLQRFEEARPVWRQALAIDPGSELAQQGLRRCEEALRVSGEELLDPPTLELDPAARDRSRQAHENGRLLMQQGRYTEAAIALRTATDEDPSWTSAWYLLGLCYAEDRQYRLAIRAFEEVLARDSDHLDAACHRADALRRSNDYQGAIAAYDRILEGRPEEVRATAGRAEALRMLGRFEEAVDWFDRTLALRPRQYLALCGKAAALNALRRYDEALPLWLAALRENPNASFVKRGLAQCRAGVGDRGDARARRSMLRRPSGAPGLGTPGLGAPGATGAGSTGASTGSNGQGNNGLGANGQGANGQGSAGQAGAGQQMGTGQISAGQSSNGHGGGQIGAGQAGAGQMGPGLYGTEAGRGEGRASEGLDEEMPLSDETRATDRTTERTSPSERTVPTDRGNERASSSERTGPVERSVPALPVAAPPTTLSAPRGRFDRDRARDELDRGRFFYKDRNYAAAASCFESALRYDPSYAEAALRLGMAHEDDRQFRKAIEAYERCLLIEPGHYQAATNIGEALRKNERYDEAIRAYDRALAMRSDYLYALAGRAECMRMLGDYQGCLVWFERALQVGPRHAFAVQGKAAALNTLQRYKEALPLWEKALEIEPASSFAKDGKAVCERHIDTQPEEDEPDSLTPVLDEQGRDLSALAVAGKLAPVVGREPEIRSVMKTLVRRLKANPLLLGDPGVGKTAVVEGVAQALVRADAPERLRNLRIIELSMGSLLAGTKYRGTFEERLKDIIKEARENPGIVLFIDEIHTLVGAGRTEGGSLDAANILKPALARGEITVIGATTVAEYRKHFEADSALDRRFQPIHVEEPSAEATVDLLRNVTHLYEHHHGVTVRPEALGACVRLSVRFVPDRRLPDKALDLLDEACADASLGSDGGVVDAARVARVVSERTSIPVHTLTEGERDRLSRIEQFLQARVIGQDAATRELAASVRLARSGLRDPRRPRGVFLFAGSSGVGKTELARSLADYLFPEGQALVKLDMSEYGDKFTGSRLLGAPPGYQGHGEEGQLTGPLRRRPYAVVLLDEFEKAHSDVQAMFLSLFDEGVVTDAEGRKVHAKEAFFVLTTNAGSDAAGRSKLGFGGDSPAARREAMLARTRQHFRPELLNRLDGLVVFDDLDDAVLSRIVELHLGRLAERALESGVRLQWEAGVAQICVARSREPGMGARPALRVIDELVAGPLGRMMLELGDGRRGLDGHWDVRAVVRDGQVVLEDAPAPDAQTARTPNAPPPEVVKS